MSVANSTSRGRLANPFRSFANSVSKSASGKKEGLNVALHGLRGVAAMMVLIAHMLGGTAEHIYANHPGYLAGVVPFHNFGTFGVLLFFVISGFVILPSVLRYSIKEFALRRFLRIYPLFLATTLLFAFLNAVTNYYPDANNLKSLFFSLTFLDLFTPTTQIAPNAWSLTYEVCFYTIASLTNWILIQSLPRPLKWIYLVIPLAFLIMFPRSAFFVCGALIYWFKPGERFVRDVGVARMAEAIALVAMIYLSSAYDTRFHPGDFVSPIPPLMIVATALYFTFAVRADSLTTNLLANRITLYLGTVSYSLYLVHPYVYYVVRRTFQQLGLFSDTHMVVSLVVFGAVTIVLSLIGTHLAHITLERWPYAWYFKQRIYRDRSLEGASTLSIADAEAEAKASAS